MIEKRILTVQDASCVGQCSLTVALPIISACGIETAVLPSALLSTHTAGFSGFTVLDLTSEFPKICEHWKKEGITFDGIYTGYVLRSQIEYLIQMCKDFNRGLKIIDPVMADNGSYYYGFDDAFAELMGKLVYGADVILPNLTEAAYLVGDEPILNGYDKDFVEKLVKKLRDKFCVKNVVLTGVSFDENELGVAVLGESGDVNYYFTEKVSKNFHGTGDIYSSAFCGALFNGKTVFESAKIAADYTVSAMKLTLSDCDKHSYGVYFEKALPVLLKSIGIL